jgi:hypothetical protein
MTTNTQLTDAALEALLAGYTGRVSAEGLQDRIMADVATTEQARRSLFALPGWLSRPEAPGRLAAIPTVAWVLLLTGLLLGLLVGGLVGGPWRGPDPAIVVVPSPVATVAVGEATILGTTKAHPLPAQAICPPGSSPEVPGPADQERPSEEFHGPMAFDRHAGRIVLVADDATWTFDVCTNVWRRMRSAQGPLTASDDPPDWLVYDADSDRTIALTAGGQFWSYDLAADRWTRAGSYPEIRRGWGEGSWSTGAVYHDPSGLVIVYHGGGMWAYDAEAGVLTEIHQRPDPSLPAGTGIPADPWAPVVELAHYDPSGGVVIGYDPRSDLLVAHFRPARPGGPSTPRPKDETWTLDLGSGTWRQEASAPSPAFAYLAMAGGPAAYDEVSGLTLFPVGDRRWLEAFDGSHRAWRAGPFPAQDPGHEAILCARSFRSPIYDALHGRIVCLGGDGPEDTSGVLALSTTTWQSRWLLEPQPAARPTP